MDGSSTTQRLRMTNATRLTLLDDLRDGSAEAWIDADSLYRPMIKGWLSRFMLQASDVDDIAQDVMAALVGQLPSFQHSGRTGAFRNWLRTTTVNAMRNCVRKKRGIGNAAYHSLDQSIGELDDPNSHLSREFDLQHTRWLVHHLLQRIESEFQSQTLAIFQMHVVEGVSVPDTANRLGVSQANVHTAKSRVLRRLRSYGGEALEML